MSPATDLQSLAAVDCRLSCSFVVTADGTGAYYFDLNRKSFAYVNLETNNQTVLALEKLENCIDVVYSTVLLDQFDCNSFTKTNFIALVCEEHSMKHFCVLFSANYQNRKVTVLDETKTIWIKRDLPLPCLYKAKCGKIFGFNCVLDAGFLSVCQIRVNSEEKIETETVATLRCLMNFTLLSSPFIEDGAVYYFLGGECDKLVKVSFDGMNSSIIPLSSDGIYHPKLARNQITQPVQNKGNLFYCSFHEEIGFAMIWSLDIDQFRWCIRAEVCLHPTQMFELGMSHMHLQILPDEAAFLLTACRNCKNTSHIYQFDFSIGYGRKTFVSRKELGRGGFGVVMEGGLANPLTTDKNWTDDVLSSLSLRQSNSHQKVAVKILHTFPAVSNEKKRKILLLAVSEAKKLKMFNHVNIVTGYGFKVDETQFLLFMELMTESVRQKILRNSEKRLEEQEACIILQQVLEGLVYLHSFKPRPIVHRDIKCANVLLDKNGNAKLADLGLVKAVSLNSSNTTDLTLAPNETAGTVYWQAPEVLVEDGSTYGRKADVWSIGCTLVEMLTGSPPNCDIPPITWAFGLKNEKLTYSSHKFVPEVSTELAKILDNCFIRQTKKINIAGCSPYDQRIRPHSWMLLKEVVRINQSRPVNPNAMLEEEVIADDVITKISRFFGYK